MKGDGTLRTARTWGVARWLGASTTPKLLPTLFALLHPELVDFFETRRRTATLLEAI